MQAAKKRRPPANDPRPVSSHRVSYVALKYPYWNRRRVTVASVLGGFAVVVAVVGVLWASAMPRPANVVQTAAPVAAQPYDIVVDEPDQERREAIAELAEAIPARAITPHVAHDVPEDAMAVAVGEKAAPVAEDGNAVFQDSVAQTLMKSGDVAQALRYEHRAAELAPDNMRYRLALAILYDQSGDGQDAALLYRQVIAAYEARDSTLPANLNIEDIRARGDYLAPMAAK